MYISNDVLVYEENAFYIMPSFMRVSESNVIPYSKLINFFLLLDISQV